MCWNFSIFTPKKNKLTSSFLLLTIKTIKNCHQFVVISSSLFHSNFVLSFILYCTFNRIPHRICTLIGFLNGDRTFSSFLSIPGLRREWKRFSVKEIMKKLCKQSQRPKIRQFSGIDQQKRIEQTASLYTHTNSYMYLCFASLSTCVRVCVFVENIFSNMCMN